MTKPRTVPKVALSFAHRVTVKSGDKTAHAVLSAANGRHMRIVIGSRKTTTLYYYARLVGRGYVVHFEGESAALMPPYLGRRYATVAQLDTLLREMLAAYVMLT